MVNAELQANIPQFYNDALKSSWYKLVATYGTKGQSGGTNQTIVPGVSTAGYTITPSVCASTAKCTVSDAQIQVELQNQIMAGNLPAPNFAGTAYFFHFPPNVTVKGPSGAGTSCAASGFCAYHNTASLTVNETTGGVPYVVLMDQYTSACAAGCGTDPTPLDNSTVTASHELSETVTDPQIGLDTQSDYAFPAAWASKSDGEVADICDNGAVGSIITGASRSWYVQKIWDRVAQACKASP